MGEWMSLLITILWPLRTANVDLPSPRVNSPLISVATPRVFSLDLGFFDPTLGSGVFHGVLEFLLGFFKRPRVFWVFLKFPRKIHVFECSLLKPSVFCCCFLSFWSIKG